MGKNKNERLYEFLCKWFCSDVILQFFFPPHSSPLHRDETVLLCLEQLQSVFGGHWRSSKANKQMGVAGLAWQTINVHVSVSCLISNLWLLYRNGKHLASRPFFLLSELFLFNCTEKVCVRQVSVCDLSGSVMSVSKRESALVVLDQSADS